MSFDLECGQCPQGTPSHVCIMKAHNSLIIVLYIYRPDIAILSERCISTMYMSTTPDQTVKRNCDYYSQQCFDSFWGIYKTYRAQYDKRRIIANILLHQQNPRGESHQRSSAILTVNKCLMDHNQVAVHIKICICCLLFFFRFVSVLSCVNSYIALQIIPFLL